MVAVFVFSRFLVSSPVLRLAEKLVAAFAKHPIPLFSRESVVLRRAVYFAWPNELAGRGLGGGNFSFKGVRLVRVSRGVCEGVRVFSFFMVCSLSCLLCLFSVLSLASSLWYVFSMRTLYPSFSISSSLSRHLYTVYSSFFTAVFLLSLGYVRITRGLVWRSATSTAVVLTHAGSLGVRELVIEKAIRDRRGVGAFPTACFARSQLEKTAAES